jgi:hypothetical protein
VDAIDLEFDEYYQRFVREGGLDTVSALQEDFERVYLSQIYCMHRTLPAKCPICTPVKRPLPDVSNGYRG